MMSLCPSSKGISPLIASIVLIAFVIAVASIVGPWFTKFVGESTNQATERGEDDIRCSSAGLYLSEVTKNETTGGNVTLAAEVQNTGDVKLSDFWIELTHDSSSITSRRLNDYEEDLLQGSRRIYSVEVNTTNQGIDSLRIFSADCPTEASDEIKAIQFNNI